MRSKSEIEKEIKEVEAIRESFASTKRETDDKDHKAGLDIPIQNTNERLAELGEELRRTTEK